LESGREAKIIRVPEGKESRQMNEDKLREQAVFERLKALEKSNRRLKQAGLSVVALLGLVFLMGLDAPKVRTMEAEQFVLRDSKGKERAVLKMLGDLPALAFYSVAGKPVMGLGTNEVGGTGLAIYDDTGRARATLGLSGGGPSLILSDGNGEPRIALGSVPDPGIGLMDANGNKLILLGVTASRPALALIDGNGQPIFAKP
jgi:hypothetical protein